MGRQGSRVPLSHKHDGAALWPLLAVGRWGTRGPQGSVFELR